MNSQGCGASEIIPPVEDLKEGEILVTLKDLKMFESPDGKKVIAEFPAGKPMKVSSDHEPRATSTDYSNLPLPSPSFRPLVGNVAKTCWEFREHVLGSFRRRVGAARAQLQVPHDGLKVSITC